MADQKWYDKATVQAAIVNTIPNILVAVIAIWAIISSSNNVNMQIEQNRELSLENYKKDSLLVELQLELASKELELNQKQFSYSKESSRITEQIAKIETRPFLIIDRIYLKQFVVGKPISFVIEVINSGKTPASQIQTTSDVKPGGTGVYSKEFFDAINFPHLGKYLLSTFEHKQKNLTWIIEFDHILTKPDSVLVVSHKKPLYIFGQILYSDIFRDKHYTRFCYQFESIDKEFSQYKDWNEIN